MDVQARLNMLQFEHDSLIRELHSLRNMYMQFSISSDGLIARSSFHIVTKDLDTLLHKYGGKQ